MTLLTKIIISHLAGTLLTVIAICVAVYLLSCKKLGMRGLVQIIITTYFIGAITAFSAITIASRETVPTGVPAPCDIKCQKVIQGMT